MIRTTSFNTNIYSNKEEEEKKKRKVYLHPLSLSLV